MTIVGEPSEPFRAVPAPVSVPAGLEALAAGLPTHGSVVWHDAAGELRGVPDGNRAAIFPAARVVADGRSYALSVKGVGALTPLYGDGPDLFGAPSGRVLWGESWFGEAPWGGQGDVGSATGVEISSLAGGPAWRGFHLCPIVSVVELPDDLVAPARDRWWYRRHRGRFVQEHRLVPSNVRLYQQAELTLGGDPDGVLAAFGVAGRPAQDAFVDRYAATGIAALTLYARSLRIGRHGPEGLVYTHVWLDKDSLVAPDGALHFADLEGLDWAAASEARPVERHVRTQFDDNWYEFAFGLDALIGAIERASGVRRTRAERRRDAANRLELALLDDPWVTPELGRGGLDLVIRPDDQPPVRIAVIDFDGRTA